jgi:hypothetical protein
MILCLLLSFVCCHNRELYDCPDCEKRYLQVVINWDDKLAHFLPQAMRIYWYPDHSESPLISNMNHTGGMERLPEDTYRAICFDYYSNTLLDFRGHETAERFEVYNLSATGLYNKYADPVPGEPTVAEANSSFYMDVRRLAVDMNTILPGDTLKLSFYPENVLREFTFLIHGVKGAKNMIYNSGAISGMSASYFPATGLLSEKPSTVLFEEITALQNGQAHRWTDEEKSLFATRNPDWQSTDSLKGWTGDWITGKFRTFGPVDVNARFRLTVGTVSTDNYYFYGSWGYWFGKWEDTVGEQIKGSVEGAGAGSWEERRDWWRARNGGYDIVLHNGGRLSVPESGGENPGGNGGFNVGTGPWTTVIVPVD